VPTSPPLSCQSEIQDVLRRIGHQSSSKRRGEHVIEKEKENKLF
jgi:hypothetical protein